MESTGHRTDRWDGDGSPPREFDLAAVWSTIHVGATGWSPPAQRTVIVSPHPDDETLSCGGLIARQRRRGLEVLVIAVTDGEGAYPDDDPAELAATRTAEQVDALRLLGVDGAHLHRLGLPDGGVAGRTEEVTASLRRQCDAQTLIVAPWVGDVHPDHEAVGRAAAAVAADIGCMLASTFFWTWHHVDPARLRHETLVTLPLTDEESTVRERALACHASQLEHPSGSPILRSDLLEPMRWRNEYYIMSR